MNTFVNQSTAAGIIAKEALAVLRNNLVLGSKVFKGYDKDFKGVKQGDTLNVKKPIQFLVTDGAQRTNQSTLQTSTPLVINKRKHVSWAFSSLELTLSVQEYAKTYIVPAAVKLANQVDMDLAALYKQLFWKFGTAGTTPTTFAAMAGIANVLDTHAVPPDDRYLVLNPAANWGIADGLKGLFFQSKVEGFVEKGKLGQIANFDVYMDQNIKQHTAGTWGTTPLINTALPASGATALSVDGLTASTGTALEGDIFTIAGVNSVNPVSKDDTGQLQPFVVTGSQTADGGGAIAALGVQPALITTGAYQTVTALPANNAVITVTASHAANMAFHKNALALVMVDLEMPDGCAFKSRQEHEGISIRVLKDYDIDSDTDIIRLDILYGVKAIYPELGGRLLG